MTTPPEGPGAPPSIGNREPGVPAGERVEAHPNLAQPASRSRFTGTRLGRLGLQRPRRFQPGQAFGLIGAFVVVLVLTHAITGFATSRPENLDVPPEIGHEWLSVSAAWQGLDPYQPLDVLSEALDAPITFLEWSPRPPGVFVIEAPLALVSFEHLPWLMAVATGVSITFLAVVLRRIFDVRWAFLPGIAAGLALASPIAQPILFLNLVVVIVAVLALSIELAFRGDRYLAGVPLGLVVAVRLWPALLIVTLLIGRRWKMAAGAGVTASVATLGGLALPTVSWTRAVVGMQSAADAWQSHDGNLSLTGFFGGFDAAPAVLVTVGLVGAVIWYSRRGVTPGAIGLAVAAGALISPLAWGSYLAGGLPAYARLARRQQHQLAWVAVGGVYATNWIGEWMTVVGLVAAGLSALSVAGDVLSVPQSHSEATHIVGPHDLAALEQED